MIKFSIRAFALILFSALLFTTVFGCGHSHSYFNGRCECGDIHPTYATEGLVFETNSDGVSCTVTDYTGTSTNVIIPKTYNGLKVNKIGNKAFYCITRIRNIHIPETIVEIGDSAFEGCTFLRSVTINENVTKLGKFAFAKCTSLEEIYYNAIECADCALAESPFCAVGDYTVGLTLYIGNKVKKVPNSMFADDEYRKDSPQITEVIFADDSQCESIGNTAFHNSFRVKSIDFGKNSNLKLLGTTAFGNWISVTSMVLPESVVQISKYAFGGNHALQTLVIPQGDWYMTKSYDEFITRGQDVPIEERTVYVHSEDRVQGKDIMDGSYYYYKG